MNARLLRRGIAAALIAAVSAGALVACSFGPEHTLRVLAGSEVQDMQPILDEMEEETGIHLEFEYMGTLDGTESLVTAAGDTDWDATWFPSNRYLSLFPEGQDLIASSQSIMRSPVVLGLKPDVAVRLGWSDATPPTWQQVVDAVDSGALRYGMTSPVASNSGFTTLVQATTALSGTGTVLSDENVDATLPALESFASGQSLTSGSSGWLADKFTEDPDAADAIFNYESVLQGLRVDGQPLTIVIPSDGVITSDYPLTLLTGASEETTETYQTVVDYLQQEDVQAQIAETTGRRTATTAPSDTATVFELPFPAKLQTVQKLLQAWVSTIRKPASMVFAIDTSGSMASDTRMEDLTEALQVLSGNTSSTSAGFLKLQPREEITYLEFASTTKSTLTVSIPDDDAGYQRAMSEINRQIDGYQPTGGTAIFDTVERALQEAADAAQEDSISSVVLFTDGENTEGASPDDFASWYERFLKNEPDAASIPVHVVVFGEADQADMEELAGLTGGRAFDARGTSLVSVFREIRGYL